jgi:UDP-3-O-[3-hydroxymyristoyl] N-acetylglucosamine deacetylase
MHNGKRDNKDGCAEVAVEGIGLHTGSPSRVVLRAAQGPVRLSFGASESLAFDLEVVSTARATTVQARNGAGRIGTVEHAFAALAGLSLYEGLAIEVQGPEMPVLDGGAAGWCEALAHLDLRASPPRARVARAASFDIGPSRFEFAPSDGRVEVHVRIDFDDPRLAPTAQWSGDREDFVARIAPARTFALAREIEELDRRGLARHVAPECVVLIAPDAIHCAGRPFSADEPARHKLLDLMGDLYLCGGPPVGCVRALRPGHAVNARAIRRALEDGVIEVH